MVTSVDIVNYLRHSPIYIDTVGDIEIDRDSIVVDNTSVIARCSIKGIEGDKSLKCYYRPCSRQQPSYGTSYIKEALLIPSISGHAIYVDVAFAEWIEGETLTDILLDDDCNYKSLSRAFDTLAYTILTKGYTHSDISPDNIIVNGDKMYLIDIDALGKHHTEHRPSTEYSTPLFSHHHRIFSDYEHLDDYSIAAISVILATLSTYRSRRSVPKLLIEFGYGNINNAIEFSKQRLLDKRDMIHYQMAMEMSNCFGQIPNLRLMLALILKRKRVLRQKNG